MALVYVVEDSPAQRELLRRALEPLGHELRMFGDGQSARKAIRDVVPDVLVSDIVLPGLSGLELCQEVRERHRRLELPIVLVSSLDRVDDLAKGYEAGADDYLLKPVEAAELRRKVTMLLERRAQRTQGASAWTRYQLLEALGRGATAVIHRARRKDDGLVVALKVVPGAAGREQCDRLVAEAELLRSLDDVPGLVRVRDVGTDGGCTYYAMDLVPGETLRARLDRVGRLPLVEAARAARELATTLAALQARGVVHCDIKPTNIVLGPSGAMLIDFGLARQADPSSTTPAAPRGPGLQAGPSGMLGSESRGGTLAYLAPEVIRGAEPSAASDLYALGVVLAESLAGRLPWPQIGAELAQSKVEEAQPDLEPLLALDVPPGLVALVEEAIAALERRTPSAAALATALLPYSR